MPSAHNRTVWCPNQHNHHHHKHHHHHHHHHLQVCPDQAPPPYLQCSNCSLGFPDPWDLMEHVQVDISPVISIFISIAMDHVQVKHCHQHHIQQQLKKCSQSQCSSCSGSTHYEHLSTVWTPGARWQWQHHFRFFQHLIHEDWWWQNNHGEWMFRYVSKWQYHFSWIFASKLKDSRCQQKWMIMIL